MDGMQLCMPGSSRIGSIWPDTCQTPQAEMCGRDLSLLTKYMPALSFDISIIISISTPPNAQERFRQSVTARSTPPSQAAEEKFQNKKQKSNNSNNNQQPPPSDPKGWPAAAAAATQQVVSSSTVTGLA